MKVKQSQDEIDKIIVSQTEDNSKWDKPIRVNRKNVAKVSIPAELAARAAFLARLHKQPGIEEWLTHIILERVELEEAAFAGAKRELKTPNGT
jgi:hypothetical protein